MKTNKILNRISTYAEYKKKMEDYTGHIKMMIGRKGEPIPLHVIIVSGDKGVGKTYCAEQILKNQDIRHMVTVNSSLSAVQFYQTMWEHNDAIIILDDVNSILQDTKDGASLLKACTDSYHVRTLQWQKMNPNCVHVHRFNPTSNEEIVRKMEELVGNDPKLEAAHKAGKTFADMFFFTGALIILTNKPLSVIDRVTEGAVSNRGWHQEMLFNADGAVDLLRNSAKRMSSFNGITISKDAMKKSMKFLTSNDALAFYKKNEKLPTLRTLGKVALEVQNNMALDEDTLANNTESPAY